MFTARIGDPHLKVPIIKPDNALSGVISLSGSQGTAGGNSVLTLPGFVWSPVRALSIPWFHVGGVIVDSLAVAGAIFPQIFFSINAVTGQPSDRPPLFTLDPNVNFSSPFQIELSPNSPRFDCRSNPIKLFPGTAYQFTFVFRASAVIPAGLDGYWSFNCGYFY